MFKKISQNFGIFLDLDEFPFSGGQIIDIPVAELFTVELLDTVACGCDHALDLMIFALGNGHHQCVWVGQHCFGGSDGFIIVMQEDAVFQRSAKGIVGRMLQGNAVELRNFVFGRSNAVVKLPVVGNQNNAGCVCIQAADCLHIDIAHVAGKKAEDARILLGFVRSFVIRRLMEQNVEIGHGYGGNLFAVNRQGMHLRRVDIVFGTIMNFAVDGDTVIVYQPLALLAAAEALRLDVFEQLHG